MRERAREIALAANCSNAAVLRSNVHPPSMWPLMQSACSHFATDVRLRPIGPGDLTQPIFHKLVAKARNAMAADVFRESGHGRAR